MVLLGNQLSGPNDHLVKRYQAILKKGTGNVPIITLYRYRNLLQNILFIYVPMNPQCLAFYLEIILDL